MHLIHKQGLPKDIQVRKALAMAIDRKIITDKVLQYWENQRIALILSRDG